MSYVLGGEVAWLVQKLLSSEIGLENFKAGFEL